MNSEEIKKAVKHLSKNDPILKRLIEEKGGCTLKPKRRYFEYLVRSIICQQLSTKAGAAIEKKFFADFGRYPDVDELAAAPKERYRKSGVSAQKSGYIKDLAAKIHSGEVSLRGISRKSNEEIISELTKIKGIGEWTAHMFLIFSLARLDILPAGDLGIKNAVKKQYKLKKLPDPKKLREIADKNRWAPYESVAAYYLWKSLEN